MCKIFFKKYILCCLFYLSIGSLQAQLPSKMSFQSILRNPSGELVKNQNIGVRISILKTGFSLNTVLYVESHLVKTNSDGLLTLQIGTGTVSQGLFGTIDWSQDNLYKLKTEFDFNGGSSYYDMILSELTTVT